MFVISFDLFNRSRWYSAVCGAAHGKFDPFLLRVREGPDQLTHLLARGILVVPCLGCEPGLLDGIAQPHEFSDTRRRVTCALCKCRRRPRRNYR
jgi:hypothetical protein